MSSALLPVFLDVDGVLNYNWHGCANPASWDPHGPAAVDTELVSNLASLLQGLESRGHTPRIVLRSACMYSHRRLIDAHGVWCSLPACIPTQRVYEMAVPTSIHTPTHEFKCMPMYVHAVAHALSLSVHIARVNAHVNAHVHGQLDSLPRSSAP